MQADGAGARPPGGDGRGAQPHREHCDGCRFEYDLDHARGAAVAITDAVADLIADLAGTTGDVATRRDADVWSPLEYACHVRDVLLVQRERVLAARRTERPAFAPMGRDERVAHDGYAEQAVGDVSRQLLDASLMLANVFGRLDTDDWDRTVMYNYPKRFERSLRWVAVHTLHEVRHHLLDVHQQLS